MNGSALVTGGSGGLGLALTRILVQRGYRVVCVDRNVPDSLNDIEYISCDLSDRLAIDTVLPRILDSGPYKLAFLNAGVSATGRFETIPQEAYRRLMTVNAETPIIMANSLVHGDAVVPGGNITFVSSLSYFTGYPGAAVYSASKDALAVYAASVRKPFAKAGCSVTCVFPGPLQTSQASRHAPNGAVAEKRMDPEVAADLIIKAAQSGRHQLMPGNTALLVSVAGRLAPGIVTRWMGRNLFEKMDNSVY